MNILKCFSKELERRDFFKTSAKIAGAFLITGLISPITSCETQESIEKLSYVEKESPSFLIRPYKEGDFLYENWKISSIVFENSGYLTVRISNDAEKKEIRVDIFTRDGKQKGFMATEKLEFFIMNKGKGRTKTPEEVAKVVKALAHEVSRNEEQWIGMKKFIAYNGDVDVF